MVGNDQGVSRLSPSSVAVAVIAREMRRTNGKDCERLRALVEA